MKNRLRALSSIPVLLLLLLASCSEGPQNSAAPEVDLGDDPAAAILEILEIQDRFDRTESLMAALRVVPDDEPDVVATVLQDLKLPLREFERILLITAWSKSDPEAATKWVMKNQKHEFLRAVMFSETTYAWALEDPEEVRTDFKVGMYSLRGWDPSMLRGLVRGWFDSGEPELESFIRDLRRNGDDRQRAISELIRVKLGKETPDAMIAWATALEGDKKFRSYVHSRLAADIAAIDPQRAVAWCDEVCETEVGKDMPHWIASSWVRDTGDEAMNWIVAQPDSTSVRIGIRSSYRRFQKSSPEGADAWLENFSDEDRHGPLLQGPVIMYVNRQSSLGNEDVAIDWTKYIENDWERERSFKLIGQRWLKRDEEAAEAWMKDETGLSDVVKAELRKDFRAFRIKMEKRKTERDAKPEWADKL